jgi:hypothetical protein
VNNSVELSVTPSVPVVRPFEELPNITANNINVLHNWGLAQMHGNRPFIVYSERSAQGVLVFAVVALDETIEGGGIVGRLALGRAPYPFMGSPDDLFKTAR